MGSRRQRRLGLALAAALLTVALAEVVAYAALVAMGAYPAATFGEMYAASGCLKSNQYNYGKYVRDRQGVTVMLGKIPHPFFGFVNNQEGTSLRNRKQHVGPDYENPLRYSIALGKDPRPADTYTIGIFGASMAVSFAEHVMRNGEFASALRQRVPSLHGKELVIRPMAIGASRQPTQLAIATHYMELFDMTVNLDGYSEQAIVMYPEYPVEFPMFGDVFFGKDGTSRYLQLSAVEYLCRAISTPGRWALLRASNAYYLFWYVTSSYLRRTFQERGGPPEPTEDFAFTDEDVRRLYASYFGRYTRYQHQLLAANGVHAYFFLQPNQYVPGSKPFSAEEKGGALNAAGADETAARYALLRSQIAELAAEGVPAFDLTGVFQGVNETVYVDSCCHVNARGNELIAAAIIDSIAREENARHVATNHAAFTGRTDEGGAGSGR